MNILISYVIFAAIATLCNLAAQEAVTRLYNGPGGLALSVAAGTGAGLVVKYLLDKRYIFRFKAKGVGHDAQLFTLYTIMGIFTTLVFWGFEFGFNSLFGTKEMRYLGAVVGLAIGYRIKYMLDKKYVFGGKVVER